MDTSFFVANWKSHKTEIEAKKFLDENIVEAKNYDDFKKKIKDSSKRNFLVSPSAKLSVESFFVKVRPLFFWDHAISYRIILSIDIRGLISVKLLVSNCAASNQNKAESPHSAIELLEDFLHSASKKKD